MSTPSTPLPALLMASAVLAASGCATPGSRPVWTIRCLELDGPRAAPHVAQIAETLRRTPGIDPKQVIVRNDMDGFSRLYYGRYHRSGDANVDRSRRFPRLYADMRLIADLGTPDGRRMFPNPLRVRLPAPDVGNPAWALTNADGVYTLEVAVFELTDVPGAHKKAAADFCALLRARGHEAYFHHASASSMVTVGAFGPDAVYVDQSGVQRVAPRVRALMRHDDLKYHLTNGALYRPRIGGRPGPPIPSQLVLIPNRETPEP